MIFHKVVLYYPRHSALCGRDGRTLLARAQQGWHDIDVLVVLRERIPTRKAWAAIMRQCQDAIGLYNLDLIPTHLEGLRQGLAEHVFILMEGD